jgi:hypothetical protein
VSRIRILSLSAAAAAAVIAAGFLVIAPAGASDLSAAGATSTATPTSPTPTSPTASPTSPTASPTSPTASPTSPTATPTTPPPTTPPPGQEGCTPGYWKNHLGSWPAPYTPSTTLGSVFTGLPAGYASLTLQQALNLGGGGLNALLRQAVSALLNASSSEVDYPLSATEVISLTNAAIASGMYEATKDVFDQYNNLGAPGFCD